MTNREHMNDDRQLSHRMIHHVPENVDTGSLALLVRGGLRLLQLVQEVERLQEELQKSIGRSVWLAKERDWLTSKITHGCVGASCAACDDPVAAERSAGLDVMA